MRLTEIKFFNLPKRCIRKTQKQKWPLSVILDSVRADLYCPFILKVCIYIYLYLKLYLYSWINVLSYISLLKNINDQILIFVLLLFLCLIVPEKCFYVIIHIFSDIAKPCLCQHGGTCKNETCLCSMGYKGEYCEKGLFYTNVLHFDNKNKSHILFLL